MTHSNPHDDADQNLDATPDDDLVRVLDEDGRVVDGATVPALPDDELVEMYAEMRLARRFDERAVSLQRQGRMGTYAPLAGQEGAQVGSTHALEPDDWVSYQYREHGAVVVRDPALLGRYLQYWMGHEAGNAALLDANFLPLNISIGGHVPHATGLAMAARYRGDDAVVVCHFGDGATSEGDFHEGLNFAGVFHAPAVFVCNNNQWAISVPRERQTAARTLAEKAVAYGFDGVRVDGMDPLAVYRVTREAVEKARDPPDGEHRPTLVEAVQYRFGAHTTADDPTVYRDEAERARWRQKDPIRRMERFLRRTGRLDDEAVEAIESENEALLDRAVEEAEAFEADTDDLFADAYAEGTPRLRDQQEALRRLRAEHGDDALLRE